MVTAISSRISDLLPLLTEQELEYQLDDVVYVIQSLKYGLQYLEIIFGSSKNEDLNLRIQGVVDNVMVEIFSLPSIPTDGSLDLDLDRYNILLEMMNSTYSNLLQMMKNVFINPETRECDVLFPKITSDLEYFLGFSELLRNILRNIHMYMPEMITEKLLFLQLLVTYAASIGKTIDVGGKEAFATLRALLEKSTFLVYLCLDKEGEMIDTKGRMKDPAMYDNVFNLLDENKVNEIALAVLRASNFQHFTGNFPLKSEIHLLIRLIWILKCNLSFVSCWTTLSIRFHDELDKLLLFLKDLPHQVTMHKLSYLVQSIEAIISGAILIICSCYRNTSRKTALRLEVSLPELFDQIERIQSEVFESGVFEDGVFEMKLYNYPKIDELGFLDLLLEHLEELLKCRPNLIEHLKNQIEALHVAFDSLRYFLRKIKKVRTEHEELEDIWRRIIELAYQAEYIIDLFLVKIARGFCIKMFSFSNVMEQAERIVSEVKLINDEEKYHAQSHSVAKRSNPLPSEATNATAHQVIVGFEDEAEKIMEYLVGGSKQLDVISIVGMPGLGKTTLAKKMYQAANADFHIRAWCSVSQIYQKRELLITLLGDLIEINEQIKNLNDEELAAKLNKSLRGRRYLIVIDDLWDINHWNDLKRTFPNDNLHSRILITTRLHDVASQIKAGSKVHRLRQLSDDESWELFQKQLSETESFSQEFLDVGKQIAESCKGLPLSIVVAAGLLAKSERNIDLWEQIAASLSSHILRDSETQCMAILELSYSELPDPLKSCFLYVGVFPEDAQISVQKLKGFWIAEGFVPNSREKSLEDIAEGYFMDLINRSLVTATKERSRGGVKACGVHDIIRDFCLEKARKVSFLQVIDKTDTSAISVEYDQRRLSFYSLLNDDLIEAEPSSWNVRSLFISGLDRNELLNICWNFRLLRVLDLNYVPWHRCYISEVISLIHLRYLAYECGIRKDIPSSIANLSNLQHLQIRHELSRKKTFYVSDFSISWNKKSISVADFIWDLVNLRNVNIDIDCHFLFDSSRFKDSHFTHDLETFSTPCFESQEHAEMVLRRLPKLRKMKCSFVYNWGRAHGFSEAVSFTFLHQLMSLNVYFHGPLTIDGVKFKLNLPSNLQKLTLSGFGQYWDEISKIGRSLSNLKVLKLIGRFEDSTWIVNGEDFPKLKYLKLIDSNIKEWTALEEDSFPILEQLVLANCWYLKAIPPCFGGISTLRMITVKTCGLSVNDSARSIHMEQHDEWQNEQFEVSIYPMKQYNFKEDDSSEDDSE